MMRRACLSFLLVVLAISARAAEPKARAAEPKYVLSVVTDRPEAIYAVGDEVAFQVKLTKDGKPVDQGTVFFVLDVDGHAPATTGKLDLARKPLVVSGQFDKPGVMRCRVEYAADAKQRVSALAGAAIDPLKIRPSLPVPDDFDAFWNRQKEQLKAVAWKPALAPVAQPDKTIECFDAQIPCVDNTPVSGYFAKPLGAKRKSLPAVLFVHGAGVGGSSLAAAANTAKRGALAMDINAHGIPNGKPKAFYDELNQGRLKDYRAFGREDREKCYFRGMFLRLIRAIDFLTSQPEWDGRVMAVAGSSQGGGQALAAAGLDARVTFIAAGVPAICDHSGEAIGRIAGWPKLVPLVDGKPDPKVLQAARYFDCMNLATRAKAEAILSVGLIDTTCPATSVYATYNNYAGKKQIITKPLMGHAGPPDVSAAFTEALWKHVAAKQAEK